MNTTIHSSAAERFGNWLGSRWRSYVRGERRVSRWLVAQGLSAGAAAVLLWIVKLFVLGTLLYTVFWLAVLLAFVAASAWGASAMNNPEDDVWPFTDMDELRNTPGYDPNLYNDNTHVDYTDD